MEDRTRDAVAAETDETDETAETGWRAVCLFLRTESRGLFGRGETAAPEFLSGLADVRDPGASEPFPARSSCFRPLIYHPSLTTPPQPPTTSHGILTSLLVGNPG